MEQEFNKSFCPIYWKANLTIEEAAVYFNIGQTKIRSLIEANPKASWTLRVGKKNLIKKNLFTEFLNSMSEI